MDPTARSVVVARRLANLMDRAIRVPFTRFEFGFDAILGLVPGAGDAAGALISAYIVIVSARAGVSRPALLRMLTNVVIETLVGVVPLLGDLFDAGWKSNVRNVRLLDEHLINPERQRKASFLVVTGTLAGLAATAALAVWSAVWLGRVIAGVAVAAGWPLA